MHTSPEQVASQTYNNANSVKDPLNNQLFLGTGSNYCYTKTQSDNKYALLPNTQGSVSVNSPLSLSASNVLSIDVSSYQPLLSVYTGSDESIISGNTLRKYIHHQVHQLQ